MVKSGMRLFKRSHPTETFSDDISQGHHIEPSNHFAMLIVKNEHFGVDYAHDLSDLTYDQLQQVHSYIQFMQHYEDMSVEDFEDEEYNLDEDEDD